MATTTEPERKRPTNRTRRAGTRMAPIWAAVSLTLGSAACAPVIAPGNGTPIAEAEVAFRTVVEDVNGDQLAVLVISFEGAAFMRTPDGENLTSVDQTTLEGLDAVLVGAGFGGDQDLPVATGPVTCSPDGYRFTIEYDDDVAVFDDCAIPEGFELAYFVIVDILNALDPASQGETEPPGG